MSLSCPICHYQPIPEDKSTCPQCDSDLVCFRVLDTIPDESSNITHVQTQPTINTGFKIGMIALSMLFLVQFFHTFYIVGIHNNVKLMDSNMNQMQSQFERITTQQSKILSTVNYLTLSKMNALNDTDSIQTITARDMFFPSLEIHLLQSDSTIHPIDLELEFDYSISPLNH